MIFQTKHQSQPHQFQALARPIIRKRVVEPIIIFCVCISYIFGFIKAEERLNYLQKPKLELCTQSVSQPAIQPATESLFNSSTNVIRRWHSILIEIDLFCSGFVFASFLYSFSIFAVTFVLKNTNLFRISLYISRFVWRVWKKSLDVDGAKKSEARHLWI